MFSLNKIAIKELSLYLDNLEDRIEKDLEPGIALCEINCEKLQTEYMELTRAILFVMHRMYVIKDKFIDKIDILNRLMMEKSAKFVRERM